MCGEEQKNNKTRMLLSEMYIASWDSSAQVQTKLISYHDKVARKWARGGKRSFYKENLVKDNFFTRHKLRELKNFLKEWPGAG